VLYLGINIHLSMSFLQTYPDKLRFAWLSNNGLTNNRLLKIQSNYETFWQGLDDDFCQTSDKLFISKIKSLKPKLDKKINDLHLQLEKEKIRLETIFDKSYPLCLRKLPNPPIVLFYQGESSCLYKLNKMITVVGSREITDYSKEVLNSILPSLANSGIGVVSGLANGVDSFSQEIILDNHGDCIAVLGMGLGKNFFYPKDLIFLRDRIIDSGGLIVSEYLPDIKASKHTFPNRNRILAALTDLTLIVQARVESGSMITAKIAQDLNKKIATIPAYLGSQAYDGNIKLLGQKAICVTKTDDILYVLGIKEIKIKAKNLYKGVSEKDLLIINSLKNSPKTVEEILNSVEGLNFSELMISLSTLELNGLVKNVDSNIWKIV
jgi:DNA processing protein